MLDCINLYKIASCSFQLYLVPDHLVDYILDEFEDNIIKPRYWHEKSGQYYFG